MVCKILESIENSGVTSWIAVKDVSTYEPGPEYDTKQKISTKVLLTDLKKLYDEKDAESTCYEIEEAVMCLRPNKPQDAVNKWKNITYEIHEKYPIIPKGDLWRNGEKIGIVEDYNSVENFGHMILEIYPPGETGYLAPDYIVKVSGKTITPVGCSWDKVQGRWVSTSVIEHKKRIFDDTNTVEEFDAPLLEEHVRAGLELGRFGDVLETAQRVKNNCTDKSDPRYFPALKSQILALMGLKDDVIFDLLELAFKIFPENWTLTYIFAQLELYGFTKAKVNKLEGTLRENNLIDDTILSKCTDFDFHHDLSLVDIMNLEPDPSDPDFMGDKR